MQHFSPTTIATWERFYRANFINSLSGYKSACLIGTAHANGTPNLAIFSNIVHLGADPALIGFVNRPIAAAPHTLQNIERSKQYTMNLVQANMLPAAHQTSAKYPADADEFTASGLTPIYRTGLVAPFVAESAIQFSLSLKEIVPITYNQTYFVIGAVEEVFCAEGLLQPDGFIAHHLAQTICTSGLDAYYQPHFIERYAYAKPEKSPEILR
jgi:flavin reductase (DIM6/NTAB) family NADH-FMN oxidoreductase RutF